MVRKDFKLSVVLVLMFFLTVLTLSGQTMFMEDAASHVPEIEFRYMRPFFSEGGSLSFFAGIYDVTLSMPYKAKTNWIVSIPFSYYSFSETGSYSESGFGNIYAGVQSRLEPGVNKGLTASAGVFLPTIPKSKFSIYRLGSIADKYRMYKYIPYTLTLRVNLTYHYYGQTFFFKLEAGPDICIPTKDTGAEIEVLTHYGMGGGFYLGDFILAAELIGTGKITEDVSFWEKRFSNSICLGVTWKKGRIRPGVYYMLSLDKYFNDYVDGVLGLKVEIDLKK